MNFIEAMNPSDDYRHQLLKTALTKLNRREDFKNIIESSQIPVDITTLAKPQSHKGIKIGIIGAGLAGLTAAYELRKLGYDLTILEGSKQHIGGRVYTHYFTKDLYGELGAMRIPVSHEATWHYINLFKLNTLPFIQESLNDRIYAEQIIIKGEDKDAQVMKKLYPKYDLNEWERRTPLTKIIEYVYNHVLLGLNRIEKNELFSIQEQFTPNIRYFDDINFYQAAKELGLSVGGMNLLNSVIGIDRELFYNSYLELIREMYTANFSHLYRLENGTTQLPQAFYKSLQQNVIGLGKVSFKMGHRVIGMSNDEKTNKVIIKYKNEAGERYEPFDYVICTVPFSQLRLMDLKPYFSNRKMQAIRQVSYSASQKTLLLCNERFWETEVNGKRIIGGGSTTDLPITSMWYPSDALTGNYGVFTSSYNIGQDAIRIGNLNDYEHVETVKRQAEEVHGLPPRYLDKVVLDYKTINWNNYDFSLGAFCWYKSGQNHLFLHASSTPEYNQKVFFAGEHTSPYHAWMQGALKSGSLAANQLASVLNQRPLY
jgi:monoamine oxidase